jgi:hypothetical protein
MQKFSEQWNKAENKKGIVYLEHSLFGGQTIECDALRIINDDEKIGVIVKGQEKFVKKSIATVIPVNDKLSISDGKLKISIKY